MLSDADTPRAAAIESKRVVSAGRPVYCEVPVTELESYVVTRPDTSVENLA